MEYFNSEADRIIFCLLELDGEIRQRHLKISLFLYKNKEAAKQWRDKIFNVINPDVCKHPNAKKAVIELNKMYERMTK